MYVRAYVSIFPFHPPFFVHVNDPVCLKHNNLSNRIYATIRIQFWYIYDIRADAEIYLWYTALENSNQFYSR